MIPTIHIPRAAMASLLLNMIPAVTGGLVAAITTLIISFKEQKLFPSAVPLRKFISFHIGLTASMITHLIVETTTPTESISVNLIPGSLGTTAAPAPSAPAIYITQSVLRFRCRRDQK